MVIIGLLAAVVAPKVMRQLEASLDLFCTEHCRYPTADEGLEILTGEAIYADTANRILDE